MCAQREETRSIVVSEKKKIDEGEGDRKKVEITIYISLPTRIMFAERMRHGDKKQTSDYVSKEIHRSRLRAKGRRT